MSRKTDYIISLEATTERALTHFSALKNKEPRLSDRGKVNASRRGRTRRATTRKKRRGPAMQYLSPARERAWEKMTNSCFPDARPGASRPDLFSS